MARGNTGSQKRKARSRRRAQSEAPAAVGALDPAMTQRVRAAMRACWETIAGDVEQSWRETGARLTRDGAAEALCDADHLETYGGDGEAVAALRAQPYEAQLAIAHGVVE